MVFTSAPRPSQRFKPTGALEADDVVNWLRRDLITVKDPPFRAAGNNAADDTGAIQGALDYAAAVGTNHGATVLLPIGIYRVTRPLEIPNLVTLRGTGFGSTIRAASTFSGSHVIRGGKASEEFATTAVRVERLSIDCAKVPGLAGFYSNTMQESSGLYRVVVLRYMTYGVHLHAVRGLTPQNWVMQDLFLIPSDTTSASTGIRIEGDSNQGVIDKASIATGHLGAAQANSACIVVSASFATIRNVHGENHRDVVRFQEGGAGFVSGVDGFNGGGLGSGLVSHVVRIEASAGDNISVVGCRRFGSVNLISDQKNGHTIAEDIPYYMAGAEGASWIDASGRHNTPSVKLANSSLPAASATYRGQVRFVQGGAGVADVAYICRKGVADTYEWASL